MSRRIARLGDSARALAEQLMSDDGRTIALEHRLRIDVSGCVIDIETNHGPLLAKLDRYFAELVTEVPGTPAFRIVAIEAETLDVDAPWTIKQPEPGKTKIKEEWVDLSDGRVVRKRLTGMVFAFGGDLHLAYGPCFRYDNQVINFVNNRYMQWRLAQGYVLAHAGAVGRGGRCLALCGPSGAGKSTAALGLVGDGLDFVSNDRLLLRAASFSTEGRAPVPAAALGRPDVEVHGIPKHPRVNPGTIVFNPMLEHMIEEHERKELLAMPADDLRVLEQKYDVLIDELVGPGRFRMHGALEALVVFNWTGEGEPSAREIDLGQRAELLPLITKSPGLFYEPEEGQALDLSDARYLETFGQARVVEITGRQDFEAARRLCLDVLDEGRGALG
jgi:HprK-related kinase B